MSRLPGVTAATNIVVIALLAGCDLGWDFLKEGANSKVGAQTNCAVSRIATGQLPPLGVLYPDDSFIATYSSPSFSGNTANTALGLRISRHRLWLDDLTIEVSFFPFDETTRDPQNGCLGRSILEINIPIEHIFFDDSPISIQSTRLSQTEVSAYYAEGGDPGFTASAVAGTLWIRSIDGRSVQVRFDLTFNPGPSQRRLTKGELVSQIDHNPAIPLLE